jgi:hypothetical protein
MTKRYMELQDKQGMSIIGVFKEIPLLEANQLLKVGSQDGMREVVLVINTSASLDVL